MPPPAPSPARPPLRLPFKVPPWALHLATLAAIVLTGVQVAWSAHKRLGLDWWAAGFVGAAGALLFGIALGVFMLLVTQQVELKLQLGLLEIAAKEVEVLQRLAGGRGGDAKDWAKRHRQVHRKRPRGEVEP